MIYLAKGRDETLKFSPKTKRRGKMDISSANIIFSVTEKPLNSSKLITKKNTSAGGGDTEVKVINNSFIVYLAGSQTKELNNVNYFYSYVIDGQLIESGYLRFKPYG